MGESAGPSGYDIIALVIAGLGLLLGGASFIWNVLEFRLTGPRVKGQLMFGMLGPGGLVSKRGSPPSDWDNLRSQGFTDPLLGIELVNHGRVSTEVNHFGCRLSNGFTLADVGLPINPLPGHVLEPHSPKTWWVPVDQVLALAKASGSVAEPVKSAHMEAEIAGPKTVRTKAFGL